jgi:dTDP-4-dehydrorhamnose reductase
MDISDPSAVTKTIDEIQPWAIINTAGYVNVDRAEEEREICFQKNVVGPLELAKACAQRGLRLVTFTSDLVFEGSR